MIEQRAFPESNEAEIIEFRAFPESRDSEKVNLPLYESREAFGQQVRLLSINHSLGVSPSESKVNRQQAVSSDNSTQ